MSRNWMVTAAATAAAGVLMFVGGAILAPPTAPPPPRPATATPVDPIEDMRERLRDVPEDWPTWAALGVSYVEQARVTGDPSYYTRAQSALQESLRHKPSGNPDALIGLGALANARHDFAEAARQGEAATAMNPYSVEAYLVLADAYTQLGQQDRATDATQRALDLDPGLPALARAAYVFELRGEPDRAREMWQRALGSAASPTDTAYVHRQLGDLARSTGDLATARTEYTLAGYRYGLAKLDGSLEEYAALVAARPEPSLLAEYAILLKNAGRGAEAEEQLRLADAALAVLAANGASDDLAGAEVALARGDCKLALKLASQELARRTHVDVVKIHQQAKECRP